MKPVFVVFVLLMFGSVVFGQTPKTDALNTETPPASGAVGPVPAYGIVDLNTSFRIPHMLELRVNINNPRDKKYFTKRPTMYPGPGIWPSDGGNMTASLAVRV